MSLPITDNLRQALGSPEPKPILIMKIDGYDYIFGNIQVKNYIRIGDAGLQIGNQWLIGGLTPVEKQHPWIQFKGGTTSKITQKLDPSKGQGSSVSQMTISIVDLNEQMTNLVSPGKVLVDVLYRKVTIYIGAEDTSWPEDYNPVFRGVIKDIDAGSGYINLTLSSAEDKKRASIQELTSTELAADVDFRSGTFQDIFYKNREDVLNTVTIEYFPGGTAGSEAVQVTGGGYKIDVVISPGTSTASQIKKAIENHPDANQLVDIKITGNSDAPQTTGIKILGESSTIELVDGSKFMNPLDSEGFRTFVKIGDELIEYETLAGNSLSGLTRGTRNTQAAYHPVEDEVTQVLVLEGNGLDIALKLMLSQGPEYYLENLQGRSVEFLDTQNNIENAIIFDKINISVEHGVYPGDKVRTKNSALPQNNLAETTILEVGELTDGSYIIVSDNLDYETTSTIQVDFKSQFNVLPVGLKMLPAEVDIDQHIFIRDTFLPTFPLDLPFDEIREGKSYMEQQIYLPMTCFAVPRKGRSSVVYTTAPLPTNDVVMLDLRTVKNPEELRVSRSTTQNFYNQVQFDYDFDIIEDKYPIRKNYPTDPDQTRIPIGTRPFLIKSQGIRSENAGAMITEQSAERLLKRYQYGAEFIKGIKIMYGDGYPIEMGDIVAVDYAALKLSDFSTGDRAGGIKLMEVQNKTMDQSNGDVVIDVVNTAFRFGDRYGLITPSSLIDEGSTTTKLILQKSWDTKPWQRESKKWNGYIGQHIIVHSEDWSEQYETTIRGFDSNNPQGMSIDPIPVAPGKDWIIDPILYPDSEIQREESFWKARHAFFSARVTVVAGLSQTRFTIDTADLKWFFVGSIIRVHNYDFTVDSPEVEVTEIDGNDIILDKPLGFVPDTTSLVDLIGFPDRQQAYRII